MDQTGLLRRLTALHISFMFVSTVLIILRLWHSRQIWATTNHQPYGGQSRRRWDRPQRRRYRLLPVPISL